MYFVYSTVNVAAMQSLESCSPQCTVSSSWILLFMCTVCLQHLMSLLPIISHHTDVHDFLHCTDCSAHMVLTLFWLERIVLFTKCCYFVARSVVIQILVQTGGSR